MPDADQGNYLRDPDENREKSEPHQRRLILCCHASFALALLCPASIAFMSTSSVRAAVSLEAASSYSDEVDYLGNNIKVKNLLDKVQNERLLSKVAASGLLSKAQAAGVSLSKLEPLLSLAADNPDILILVEASGPELLPLLPALVDLAPGALPLLGAAVAIPAPLIGAAGVASLGAAYAACQAIPDDSVINVALQTLIVGLALPAAGVSFAGAAFLGKLK